MTDHNAVVLNMSDELYRRIAEAAEAAERPVETVLLESLSLLFGVGGSGQDITPEMLEAFSDEQLWALVYRRMLWPSAHRLRELTEQSRDGALTDEERAEQDALLEQIDAQMLVRSHALRILQQRGHDVADYLAQTA
jgi:uncharacterized protein YnzC (UPF0291/DUF896 family)